MTTPDPPETMFDLTLALSNFEYQKERHHLRFEAMRNASDAFNKASAEEESAKRDMEAAKLSLDRARPLERFEKMVLRKAAEAGSLGYDVRYYVGLGPGSWLQRAAKETAESKAAGNLQRLGFIVNHPVSSRHSRAVITELGSQKLASLLPTKAKPKATKGKAKP